MSNIRNEKMYNFRASQLVKAQMKAQVLIIVEKTNMYAMSSIHKHQTILIENIV